MTRLRRYLCNGILCRANIQYVKSHTFDHLFRNKNWIDQNGHPICQHMDLLGSTQLKNLDENLCGTRA